MSKYWIESLSRKTNEILSELKWAGSKGWVNKTFFVFHAILCVKESKTKQMYVNIYAAGY